MAHANGEVEFLQGSDGVKRRYDYGSLANRPFGEEEVVCFGPESVTFSYERTGTYALIMTQIPELDEADSIVVTVDGTSYPADFDGTNSNAVHRNYVSDDVSVEKTSGGSTYVAFAELEDGEHEVSITATVVHRLDAKYIPESAFDTGLDTVETLYDGAPTAVNGSEYDTTATIQQSGDYLFDSLSQHAGDGGYIRTTVVVQDQGMEPTLVLTGRQGAEGPLTGDDETFGVPMSVSWWMPQMEERSATSVVEVVLSVPDVTVTNVKVETVEPHRLNTYNLPAGTADAIESLEASKADSIWYDGNRIDVVTALNAICDAAGLQISFGDEAPIVVA